MARPRSMSPAERSLLARQAAHTMHAQYDVQETTAKARASFLAKFEREVDPDGVLPLEERRRRAEHLRRAHFARLARASARVRRAEADRKRGGDGTTDRQQ
jgi:hypothetical protein